MENIKIYSNGCDWCLDSDGLACLPEIGIAPHTHDISKTGSAIGSTIFTPDKINESYMTLHDDGMVTYYCITEGCPNSKKRQNETR